MENATWLTENDGILSIKAVNHVRDSGDYVCIVQNLLTGAREATPPATLDIVCEFSYFFFFTPSECVFNYHMVFG